MAKYTCEESKRMPISFLKQKGYLGESTFGGNIYWWTRGEPSGNITIDVDTANTRVRCRYTRTLDNGNVENFDYSAPPVTTPCYFGNSRYWYLCPFTRNGKPCNARVGVLYMVDCTLGCRKCKNLAYESQQETHTGEWSVLRNYLLFESRHPSQNGSLRVKYWKGQATKRFRKVLRDLHRLEQLSSVVANMNFQI